MLELKSYFIFFFFFFFFFFRLLLFFSFFLNELSHCETVIMSGKYFETIYSSNSFNFGGDENSSWEQRGLIKQSLSSQRKHLFRLGCLAQKGKQDFTNVVAVVKMAKNLTSICSPLSHGIHVDYRCCFFFFFFVCLFFLSFFLYFLYITCTFYNILS